MQAVRIAAGLVAVLLVVFAVPLIRSGLGEWRGGGGKPISQRYGLLVDKQTRAGYDRSGLIIGLGFAFMSIMVTDFAIMNLRDVNRVEALVFAVASAGMIVCVVLFLSIVILNRPKFLVPPQHRGERGAFAAQHRRREGRHVR